MILEKYSIGIGDRFGMEGAAQVRALQKAARDGVSLVPVWNKSNREHSIIGTNPNDTLLAAMAAVKATSWTKPFYLDADHIGLATLDKFIEPCNFFTIDVADVIGRPADQSAADAFLNAMHQFRGTLVIPGMHKPITVDDVLLNSIARKYLLAVTEAGKVYRRIIAQKPEGSFVAEMSLDEADVPQSPAKLFFILAAVAREGIPLQTIAPKFTGDFLKGIDYVGDTARFETEFRDHLAVVGRAISEFGLPASLKLSVHTGSDKFSLYPLIRRAILDFDAGLHLKTAGTTWLEEVIGLAGAGGDALLLAKEVYAIALTRYDELCKPYATVVRIDRSQLPDPADVQRWTSAQFVEALRHDRACPCYNIHFRQFMHVSFRIAAEMSERYLKMLREHRSTIEHNVTTNLYDRHLKPLFVG